MAYGASADAGLVQQFQRVCSFCDYQDETTMSRTASKTAAKLFWGTDPSLAAYDVMACEKKVFGKLTRNKKQSHIMMDGPHVEAYLTEMAHEIAKLMQDDPKLIRYHPYVTLRKSELEDIVRQTLVIGCQTRTEKMATGEEDLVGLFNKYCKLGGGTSFNRMACGKLVNDSWSKKFKDVKSIVDASVFPAMTKGNPKKCFDPTTTKIDEFVERTAYEIAKRKDSKAAKDSPEVAKIKGDLMSCLKGPDVKEVKQSKTGNVGGLTDTSQYTGAHKERFGADGKGKGAAGREDKVENTGYVGNYKGDGTYDGKK